MADKSERGTGQKVADGRGGAGRRLKTVRDVSAGGVAYRQGPEGIEVVLVGRHEPGRWVLPKGTPNQGESLDQTAMRERASPAVFSRAATSSGNWPINGNLFVTRGCSA